jgi:hypothetical protein
MGIDTPEEEPVKITVCEFPDEATPQGAAWTDLVHALWASPTDVVVLPEMPFCDRKIFTTKIVDLAVWREALAVHDTMITRFSELSTAMVLASPPTAHQGKRLSQAFSWT